MSNKHLINRRDFLLRGMAGGLGLALTNPLISAQTSLVLGANDRLRVGVIGLGEKGFEHIKHFLSLPNVEIAALCDTQETARRSSVDFISKSRRNSPLMVSDYRYLLDLPNIDVLSVAVPRNLRAPFGIEAIRANKHLLLEKPFSLTIKEGQKLVEEARKYNRIVQQRDDNFFISRPEIDLLEDITLIGKIKRATGFKEIYTSELFSNEKITAKRNQLIADQALNL